MPRFGTFRVMALALAPWAGACSDAVKLPQLPQLVDGPGEPMRAPGTTAEVYARIAQAARACWFGPDGALKDSYIFHAELEPPSRGEAAEISVHELDKSGSSRWGRKVFYVSLLPADGQTAITVENVSFPVPVSAPMRADVFQWSQGGAGCTTKQAPGLPQPASAAQTPATPAQTAKGKTR